VERLILLARRWTNEDGDVWRLRGDSASSSQSGGGNPRAFRPPEAVDRLDEGIYILGGNGGRRRTIACTSQSPGTTAPWSSSRKTKVTWIVLRFQHS